MLIGRYFKKRTYTFQRFLNDIGYVISNRKKFLNLMNSGRINSRFQEHIMLAVTAVNGCIYCEWVHTKIALDHARLEP